MPESSDGRLERVTKILCGLLERNALDPDEDFYDAGVTSTMMLPLLVELEEAFGLALPEEDFMDSRTANALAHLISRIASS
jgi:acyl carrier protein